MCGSCFCTGEMGSVRFHDHGEMFEQREGGRLGYLISSRALAYGLRQSAGLWMPIQARVLFWRTVSRRGRGGRQTDPEDLRQCLAGWKRLMRSRRLMDADTPTLVTLLTHQVECVGSLSGKHSSYHSPEARHVRRGNRRLQYEAGLSMRRAARK